jgi:hypothetical protein
MGRGVSTRTKYMAARWHCGGWCVSWRGLQPLRQRAALAAPTLDAQQLRTSTSSLLVSMKLWLKYFRAAAAS